MLVIWTPGAEKDRMEIWNYIATNNPHAASRMDAIFSNAAKRLSNHPKLGKLGKITGTRELIPHKNFRLVYEINDGIIWIHTLMHTARLWPPMK